MSYFSNIEQEGNAQNNESSNVNGVNDKLIEYIKDPNKLIEKIDLTLGQLQSAKEAINEETTNKEDNQEMRENRVKAYDNLIGQLDKIKIDVQAINVNRIISLEDIKKIVDEYNTVESNIGQLEDDDNSDMQTEFDMGEVSGVTTARGITRPEAIENSRNANLSELKEDVSRIKNEIEVNKAKCIKCNEKLENEVNYQKDPYFDQRKGAFDDDIKLLDDAAKDLKTVENQISNNRIVEEMCKRITQSVDNRVEKAKNNLNILINQMNLIEENQYGFFPEPKSISEQGKINNVRRAENKEKRERSKLSNVIEIEDMIDSEQSSTTEITQETTEPEQETVANLSREELESENPVEGFEQEEVTPEPQEDVEAEEVIGNTVESPGAGNTENTRVDDRISIGSNDGVFLNTELIYDKNPAEVTKEPIIKRIKNKTKRFLSKIKIIKIRKEKVDTSKALGRIEQSDSLNSIPSSEDNYNLNLEPKGNKGKQAEDIFTVEDINEKVNEARNKEGYVNNDEIKVIEREESISSQSDEQKSESEITVENKKYLVENLPGVALRTIIREKPIEKKVTIRNPRSDSLNWREQYPQYSSVNNSPIMKPTADKGYDGSPSLEGKSPSINHSSSLH